MTQPSPEALKAAVLVCHKCERTGYLPTIHGPQTRPCDQCPDIARALDAHADEVLRKVRGEQEQALLRGEAQECLAIVDSHIKAV